MSRLDANMNSLAIEPIQNEPLDHEHDYSGNKHLIVFAEQRIQLGSKMNLNGVLNELIRPVGQQISRDGVRANHAQRKAPGILAADVDRSIESRQEEETQSAAVKRPRRRPNSLHARTNTISKHRNIFERLNTWDVHGSMRHKTQT